MGSLPQLNAFVTFSKVRYSSMVVFGWFLLHCSVFPKVRCWWNGHGLTGDGVRVHAVEYAYGGGYLHVELPLTTLCSNGSQECPALLLVHRPCRWQHRLKEGNEVWNVWSQNLGHGKFFLIWSLIWKNLDRGFLMFDNSPQLEVKMKMFPLS